MKWLDPLAPDHLVLPGRASLDGMADNRRTFGRFQLEPVLALQLSRPDHAERARGAGRANSSPTMTPALYKRCPCRWGAGAICVGQTRPKSAIRAAIRSGGAATIRSWSFLIFIGPSPHHVRCDLHEDATIRPGGGGGGRAAPGPRRA